MRYRIGVRRGCIGIYSKEKEIYSIEENKEEANEGDNKKEEEEVLDKGQRSRRKEKKHFNDLIVIRVYFSLSPPPHALPLSR